MISTGDSLYTSCTFGLLNRYTLLCSILGNEDEPDAYELHFTVKDYNFARTDSLVGVTVMQLGDIVEQVSNNSSLLSKMTQT